MNLNFFTEDGLGGVPNEDEDKAMNWNNFIQNANSCFSTEMTQTPVDFEKNRNFY